MGSSPSSSSAAARESSEGRLRTILQCVDESCGLLYTSLLFGSRPMTNSVLVSSIRRYGVCSAVPVQSSRPQWVVLVRLLIPRPAPVGKATPAGPTHRFFFYREVFAGFVITLDTDFPFYTLPLPQWWAQTTHPVMSAHSSSQSKKVKRNRRGPRARRERPHEFVKKCEGRSALTLLRLRTTKLSHAVTVTPCSAPLYVPPAPKIYPGPAIDDFGGVQKIRR